MVLVLNIEDSLHNIYPIAFKCLSGNAGSTVSMLKKRKFKNLIHNLSSRVKHQQHQRDLMDSKPPGPVSQGGVKGVKLFGVNQPS